MVERNLLREGFIYNTRTPLGTISGTQIVSPPEIDGLADGDVATTALLVSGTKFTSLDADLGARFKINRIELYVDDPTSSGFTMQVSDDGSSFLPVTMTGSAGLYVSQSDRFSTTASGSPRYIRYEQRASSNRSVNEWSIVSDDTIVDFGSDGLLSELQIQDAPVGRPSDQVTTLTLKNSYDRTAEGFVFIDNTDNDAESQLEISTSPTGPWFGKTASISSQPSITPWEVGTFSNTRAVPSGIFFQNFTDGTSKGWAGTNATTAIVGGVLRGTSTTTSPQLRVSNPFQTFRGDVFNNTEVDFYKDYFAFRAVDANTVKIRLKVNTPISAGNLVQGTKLFWRNQENETGGDAVFRSTLSTFPIGGDRPPTNGIDTLIFDVGSVPTWSGTIRGFAIQPFIVSTGTGFTFDLYDIEVYHTDGNRVTLDFFPVNSGTFANTDPNDPNLLTLDSIAANSADTRTLLSMRHTVMQDSIITKVRWFVQGSTVDAIFLARPLSTSLFPTSGTNFSIPYAITIEEIGANPGGLREFPVFWSAQKGDIIGAYTAGANNYYSSTSGTLGDSYRSTSALTTTSTTTIASSLNSLNNWVQTARNYLIEYDAIPTEIQRKGNTNPYRPTGTYTTPVFDLELSPALADLEFSTSTPPGTSIDSLGASGFQTVRARARDIPPQTSLRLGEVGPVSGVNDTLFLHLNDAASVGTAPTISTYQINTSNEPVKTREVTTAVNNFGGAIWYNKLRDELWVMNCVISGTDAFLTTDVRPIWDVFNPYDGSYIRTQKMEGGIFYSYNHPNTSETHAFEPVGFVADYTREELYLFQRENGFFVGAGSYYGLVLNLDGTFKDVFWREGSTSVPNANRFNATIGFTYAPNLQGHSTLQTTISGVFFTLNSTQIPAAGALLNRGTRITAYRNGIDTNERDIHFINETIIQGIPGLSWATNPPDARGIVYNENTGNLNLLFDSRSTVADSIHHNDGLIVELKPVFNTTSNTFDYLLVGSGDLSAQASRNVDGYIRENSGTSSAWQGSRFRFFSSANGTGFTTGVAHNTVKDTFVILRTYTATRSADFPNDSSDSHLNFENHSFLAEVGAGSTITIGPAKKIQTTEPIWGALSGTLSFQDISTEGFNFPTGRYCQVQYQLNADSNGTKAPSLLTSQIARGMRIGTIGAGQTKDIYVRTNIPEDQPIGDQVGKLKVYWETTED